VRQDRPWRQSRDPLDGRQRRRRPGSRQQRPRTREHRSDRRQARGYLLAVLSESFAAAEAGLAEPGPRLADCRSADRIPPVDRAGPDRLAVRHATDGRERAFHLIRTAVPAALVETIRRMGRARRIALQTCLSGRRRNLKLLFDDALYSSVSLDASKTMPRRLVRSPVPVGVVWSRSTATLARACANAGQYSASPSSSSRSSSESLISRRTNIKGHQSNLGGPVP
jgi:hypothetical protein